MDRRARQRIVQNTAAPEPAAHCVHGAEAGACAFYGCAHYRPDGPRDERWAFRPGTTPEDITAALAENAADLARPSRCVSPIHLVVELHRQRRVERAWASSSTPLLILLALWVVVEDCRARPR